MDVDKHSALEPTKPAIKFHTRFAFPDGDLIFSASPVDKNDSKTYFRVHKAMLRLHSSTFSDMFDMPLGDSVSDATSEVLHLHDDSSALVELLKVIYYPE